MTKKELKEKLIAGAKLEQLFEFCDGQECLMYKQDSFEISDEILYIPDIMYYELVTERPITDEEVHEKQIEWILHNCYTGEDFLSECNGHENVAKELFEFVDWQSPNVRDLLETYEEAEFQKNFGFSKKKFKDKALFIS